MSPKMSRGPASKGNDRKKSDLLPDLEDLGKLLKNCSPIQVRQSTQGQTSDRKSCSTCVRKAAFGKIVQSSSELTEQENPIFGEVMLHTKDHESINITRN